MAETLAANVAIARERIPAAETRARASRYVLVFDPTEGAAGAYRVAERADDGTPAGFVFGADGAWHVEVPPAPGDAQFLRVGGGAFFVSGG